MVRRTIVLASLFLFAACAGTPAPVPSPNEPVGRGIVAFDAEPPAGVTTYARPELRVGDRFTLLRGGVAKGQFEVTAAGDQGYVIGMGGEVCLKRDRDLGNLGEWTTKGDVPQHVLEPVDARFHWPLWVGKRWRCEFVDRTVGGAAMPMEASYEVEDLDTVKVPAGTFEALRIVRQVRLLGDEGKYLTRTQLIWYAPSLGTEVRQILGDTTVELFAWQRGS